MPENMQEKMHNMTQNMTKNMQDMTKNMQNNMQNMTKNMFQYAQYVIWYIATYCNIFCISYILQYVQYVQDRPWRIILHNILHIGLHTATYYFAYSAYSAYCKMSNMSKIERSQKYAIGFNTVVKRTKLAAGLFTIIHWLCIMMAMLWFFVPRRSGIEWPSHSSTRGP